MSFEKKITAEDMQNMGVDNLSNISSLKDLSMGTILNYALVSIINTKDAISFQVAVETLECLLAEETEHKNPDGSTYESRVMDYAMMLQKNNISERDARYIPMITRFKFKQLILLIKNRLPKEIEGKL